MAKGNFTYVLRCSDDSLYTGWTTDVEKRVKVHNQGKGAKYTKVRRPVTLVYFESFPTKQEAQSREWNIKQLKRPQKLALIRGFDVKAALAKLESGGTKPEQEEEALH